MIRPRHKQRAAALLLPAALALHACTPSYHDIYVDAQGPFEVGAALAYYEANTGDLLVVSVEQPGEPGQVRRLADFDHLSDVTSAPRPDSAARQLVAVQPSQQAVVVLRDPQGAAQSIDIGVPLETIDITADGRYGIAYQAFGSTPSQALLTLPNTIAVVDLHPDSASAASISLGGSRARPIKAVFSDSLILEAQGSAGLVRAAVPLALVFVEGGIVPVDLASKEVGRMVQLSGADERANVIPAEVLFTNNQGDERAGGYDGIERAFVRTTSGQLYVLSITLSSERLTGNSGGMAVAVALENIVTPDAFVHDTELFFTDDGNSLLLAAAGSELVLVNGYSGVATRFPTEHKVDTLHAFVDPISARRLAIGYCKRTPARVLLRLDALGLDRRRATGMEQLYLSTRLLDVEVAPAAGRAVLRYESPQEIGLLELIAESQPIDITLGVGMQAKSIAADGSRLWVVAVDPTDRQPYLVQVNFSGVLSSDRLRLDVDARSVGGSNGVIWVDHETRYGAVTFVRADDLQRSAATLVDAFLLTDLFDTDPEQTAHPIY